MQEADSSRSSPDSAGHLMTGYPANRTTRPPTFLLLLPHHTLSSGVLPRGKTPFRSRIPPRSAPVARLIPPTKTAGPRCQNLRAEKIKGAFSPDGPGFCRKSETPELPFPIPQKAYRRAELPPAWNHPPPSISSRAFGLPAPRTKTSAIMRISSSSSERANTSGKTLRASR